MEIKISKINPEQNEVIYIYCHGITEEVKEIVSFVKSRQGQISAHAEGKQFEISISDIFYIESIDNKCFVYCAKSIYETKEKLYILEEGLQEKNYLRVSKSILLNLMKVTAIKPALNGRFLAILHNGEEVIISRKYVPELKKKLKGKIA